MQRRPTEPPARPRAALIAITWLIAAGGAIAVLLIGASSAEGGTYRAAQCHARLGAGAADFSFERSSRDYEGSADCASGGSLTVHTTGSPTRAGRWGGWFMRAPAGASLVQVSARAGASPVAGHVAELLVGQPDSEPSRFASPSGRSRRVRWAGEGAESFQARLRCRRSGGCGGERAARLAIRRIYLRLSDALAPRAGIAGAIGAGQTQRGSARLAASATDTGGGVRRLFVEVNGDPVAARGLECSVRRGVALRVQPCPPAASPEFVLDTAVTPFRQGPNELRVCAVDYASQTEPNRDCAARPMRVDNECPVDADSDGRALEAEIAARRRAGAVRRGDPARVVGRLVDEAGEGVGEAEVCVATRVVLDGEPERVIATPRTGGDGRFEVRLPTGPSREVRVAHWSGPERVTERILPLRVSSRPRLSLSDRTLRNGERVRFSVKLHGPRPGGRQVYVKAYTGKRWVRVRSGHTDSRGRWSESYRFTHTTGTRTYRFRAHVPKQRGYPYEAGRSAVRRARVSG